MMALDEDALICDFAETYQIYDYRSLPVRLAATLAAGLRDNSRIKLLAAEVPVCQDIILLAGICDRIDALRYMLSDPSSRGTEPPSIIKALFGEKTEGRVSFKTVDEFEKALARARGE